MKTVSFEDDTELMTSFASSSSCGDDLSGSSSSRANQRAFHIHDLVQEKFQTTTPSTSKYASLQIPATASSEACSSGEVPAEGKSVPKTPTLLIQRTPYTVEIEALPRPHSAPSGSFSRSGSNETPPCHQPIRRRAQSDSFERPASVIPDSQPVAAGSINDRGSLEFPHDLKRYASSVESSATEENAESPINPAKRIRRHASPPISSPSVSSHTPVPTTSLDRDRETGYEADIIRPPLPRHPLQRTAITPALARLATHLPLSRCWHDTYLRRRVDPDERGHWIVQLPLPVSSGGAKESECREDRLWNFLHQFIGGGKAGWDVWAIRERERERERLQGSSQSQSVLSEAASSGQQSIWNTASSQDTISSKEADTNGPSSSSSRPHSSESKQTLSPTRASTSAPAPPTKPTPRGRRKRKKKKGLLRIYSFGEAIPYVYALLWLASERALPSASSSSSSNAHDDHHDHDNEDEGGWICRWLDAAGQIVVSLSL